MKSVIITMLYIFSGYIVSANAQQQSAATFGVDNNPQLMKDHHMPSLGIAVSKDGKSLFSKVYGVLSENEPAPYNTIFNAVSLTDQACDSHANL